MVVTPCLDVGVSEQENRKNNGDYIPARENEALSIVNISLV